MNAQNLAIRCAFSYLKESRPDAWSAADRQLIADAITTGLSEYWQRAPQHVIAPNNLAGATLTTGTQDFALPLGFEQVTKPVRIRTSSAEAWIPLANAVKEVDDILTGIPRYYRVLGVIDDQPIYDGTQTGGTPSDYILRFYGPADRDYEIDLGVQYECPVVRLVHLTGARVVNLPISDIDIITNVVPLCGPAFYRLPFRKTDLVESSINSAFAQADARMKQKPKRLTRTPGRVYTPRYW